MSSPDTTQDRYAVIVVSKWTGDSHTYLVTNDADEAHNVAASWNGKHQWHATVVGLHTTKAGV